MIRLFQALFQSSEQAFEETALQESDLYSSRDKEMDLAPEERHLNWDRSLAVGNALRCRS